MKIFKAVAISVTVIGLILFFSYMQPLQGLLG